MRSGHKRISLIQGGSKTESAKTMANYIKDRWNTNFKKWLEGNFNKLNGNEIDSTITELIKNFNSA